MNSVGVAQMSTAPISDAITAPSIRPMPLRGKGFVVVPLRAAAVVVFAGILVGWESLGRFGLINTVFLPTPTQVVGAFFDLFAMGTIYRHVGDSMVRLLGGWLLGTVAGLSCGFAIGMLSLARAIGVPVISAMFPIPKIAILPLLILWMGIGEAPKIATVALGVFFPTAISTYCGVDNVPRNLIRMAQSFNLSMRTIIFKVLLPGTLPAILSGFRITASIALILLVAAEMIGAQYGIGAFILSAGNLMQTDQLLAGVMMLSLLGLLVHALLSKIEAMLLRWR